MSSNLLQETIFTNQAQAEDDMCYFQTVKAGATPETSKPESSSTATSLILQQIADARKQIQNSLNGFEKGSQGSSSSCSEMSAQIDKLTKENNNQIKNYADLQAFTKSLECRVSALEARLQSSTSENHASKTKTDAENKDEVDDNEEDDDDFELFGDDDNEDNEAAEKIKQDRIAAYNEKKSNKVTVVAKSNVILDIKPWDDETDLDEMEKLVRSIAMDGLLWGASKQVPLAYGIKKLQISTVIVDDKVSVDLLEELICGNEDFVQSVDIAAFNKI